MEGSGMIFRLFAAMDWIMRFAYVHFVWLLFTVLGLGVFGLFPATNAMFAIMRKWLAGEQDIAVFSFMWKNYKAEFLKCNGFFYSLLLQGGLLYFYLRLFQWNEGLIFTILSIILTIIGLVFCISLVVAMPIYVHYQMGILSFYKTIWYIVLSFPFHMITVAAILVGFYYLMYWIPGLFPFLSFSVLAFLIMWVLQLVFHQMDAKKTVTMIE